MTFTHSRFAAVAAFAFVLGAAPVAQADEEDKTGFELGAFVGYHVFNDDNELGQVDVDNADSPENAIAFGVRVGYGLLKMDKLLLGVEGELALMPSRTRNADTDVLAIGWRGHGYLTYDTGNRVRPFALLGAGGSTAQSSDKRALDNDTDFVWHAGVGAKVRLEHDFGVRLDLRGLLPPSSASEFATVDFEILLGFYKTFGAEPKKAPPPPPPAPKDTDGDGLTDDKDKCPNEAEDQDGFQDEDGCPDTDNDGDGIPDATDKCPGDAETKNGVDDEDGCPETDDDGDGLVGSADKCPNEPEDKDGFQDDDGCPDADNDGDSIADAQDKCPMQPETMNGFQDADGCPDKLPEKIKKFTGVIKGIRFVTGSAKLRASSFKVLRQVVKVMTEFPNLRMNISGYTDDRGKRDKNITLSQKRADAVKAYLVKKGVDESRLEAKGFGPDNPIADNKTFKGRAQNRRVEFAPITGAPK